MVSINANNFNESLRQAKKVIDEQKRKLNSLISPFLTKSLSKKEVIELGNLGKFILQIDEDVKILAKRESPDFVIENKGTLIGLEIEGIFNAEKVQSVKSIEKLFENAAVKFREIYPDIKALVNFQIDRSFVVRQKEKKEKIEQIINYVYGLISKNTVQKPDFIESTEIMKHSRLNFNYFQGAYFVNHINDELIKKAIQKKEDKFENYTANSNTAHQWLLIVIDSGAAESYVIDEDISLKKVSSKFERIYILEDLINQVTRIK